MMPGWAAALATLAYVCAMFALAHFGDTRGRAFVNGRARPAIYAFGLAVYCTSWTFFGSVGLASTTGFDFLPIYIGPFIIIGLCYPFVRRLVQLAKAQNTTSVSDFIAARYGKADKVAVCATLLCVVGSIPYIALQLKAVAAATSIVIGSIEAGHLAIADLPAPSLAAPVILAVFAIAFGTRRIDATVHQDGLMLAVAAESIVKLLAFLAVGVVVTYVTFGGPIALFDAARANDAIREIFLEDNSPLSYGVMTALSAFAILLLPRQFHVTIVENRDERDVKTAAWLFPLYLVLINIFVVPLVIAGLLTFPSGTIDRDMTVLALPLQGGHQILAVFVMLGGLSAATAMIVVECVALSIMVSNDLVLPFFLRRARSAIAPGDLGTRLLVLRRLAILGLLALGHLYLLWANTAGLASIGLISFACIAQIAPAFFGGLVWRRATADGAVAGMAVGGAVWFYMLFLPSLRLSNGAFTALVEHGPFGIEALRPGALFDLDMPPLVQGVLLSLSLNVLVYIAVSLRRQPTRIERLQADVFVGGSGLSPPGPLRLWRASVSAGELESTVARYLGPERARGAFDSYFAMRDLPADRTGAADVNLLRYAEHLLASAIGAASSRLALSLLLRRRNVSPAAALQLVDTASAAIQYNRDVLQYALDFARQGITIFDRELRLVSWNREFRDLFDLPADVLQVGAPLDAILRSNALRGLYGPGPVEDFVESRRGVFVSTVEPFRIRLRPTGRVVEMRSSQLPDGGFVTTHTDVTAQVDAEEHLAAVNETLEQRVRARTEELVALNEALAQAKALADEANLSKTRFLAAAGHDILQPLNAARLYASTLGEQMEAEGAPAKTREMTGNIDASLEAVGDIITALLDISRLDAGALRAEMGPVRLSDLFAQLAIEFGPLARSTGVTLVFVATSATVLSDRRLLRRLLQNLVSNGVKYSPGGRVLIGVRRIGGKRRIEVHDTGIGIPDESRESIFEEFLRLEPAQRTARGLGLGLSIVRRLTQVLDHDIGLRSEIGKGSMFWITAEGMINTPEAKLPRPAAPRRPVASLDGLHVCVIENEAQVLDGMHALLEGWHCAVTPAASLDEARNRLVTDGRTPDAFVADYHLDDGTGIDAIVALRAAFGADIPAILVTADRSEDVRTRAAAADILVLHKPVRPAALRAALSQRRVKRDAAE